MKKRTIAFLLAVILCISLFPVSAGADETVYITESGRKYHNAGCKYLSDSCIPISLSSARSQGYEPCSVCHAPVSHVHSWNSGVITVAATCNKNGTRTYTCTGCGQTKTESIPATGVHSWDSGTVTKVATCVATGVRTYTCKNCGQKKTESIPVTGNHQWNSGSVITPASCAKNGTKEFACLICGTTKTESIPVNNSHSWDEGVIQVEPTLTEDGKKVYTCKECGATIEERIPALGYPFDDIESNYYCWLPAKWAYDNGIANGMTPTSFCPDKTCTRAQVVTFLWRAFGAPEPTSTENPFEDVTTNTYYYKPVLWAVENGITNGTSKVTFSPDRTVTRGQAVTFLWRASASPEISCETVFDDIQPLEYYYPAVLWAVSNEITNGTSANKFSPAKGCTRGQIVTFLYRAISDINE